MKIELDNLKLQYNGRIDFSNPKKPEFIYPASFIKFRFRGTRAKAIIRNRQVYWSNYIGIIIDGDVVNQKSVLLSNEGEAEIILAESLSFGEHEILLFKRMDACHEFVLEELELSEDSELLEVKALPERKIEVFGDSVSAGEVSEAVDYIGIEDPEHEGEYSNSWYSYAWIAARKLNAQLHDVAQGGIALLNQTGWYSAPDYIGLEYSWDKLHYAPELGKATKWDFARYTPHVVIIAIGQNDNHPEDYMKADYGCEKSVYWRARYKEFVKQIRDTYPNARVILTTTILEHDASWDKSIEQVCNELADEKVTHFLYSKNGVGTKGHIRIPEAEVMGEELAKYIETFPADTWES
jgi:hypothetical protein